jgi:DNA-binding transcriptional LysR family regulator
MPRNLDPALLRAFVTVAETAGMTSAANVLHLTQAAVSQQVKRLEEAFGCELFERERRGLRLTQAGERLFGKAKRLLALNDEIWAEMTTPLHKGAVRLGIPYDLVGTYLPAILKAFSQAYPQVQISIACQSSPRLRQMLDNGELDLAVVEELTCGREGECLASDRLVWVGARGGEAYAKRPLPISFGNETCAFRPATLEALRTAEIDWRAVSEIGNEQAMSAMVHTDLAVTVVLASTVPPGFDVLGKGTGLPSLPNFSINLYLPKAGALPPALEFARFIREGFLARQRQAA